MSPTLYIVELYYHARKGETQGKKSILDGSEALRGLRFMLYNTTSIIGKLLGSNKGLFSRELQKQDNDNKTCHNQFFITFDLQQLNSQYIFYRTTY